MEARGMIQNGYRLYDGLDGKLHFDQIVGGMVYPLKPEASDAKLKRGFYDPDFGYIGDDAPTRDAAPASYTADIDYDRTEDIDWHDDWHEQERVPGGRSEGGQFGKGHGGSASQSKTPLSDLMKDDPTPSMSKEQRAARAATLADEAGLTDTMKAISARLDAGTPTDKLHKDSAGNWTDERQAIHDKILDKLFSDDNVMRALPRPGQKKTMTLLGGRGGSGKSWLTKNGPVDKSNAILVDADEFKKALPEYQGWNAFHLHEESDHLVSRAQDRAKQLGVNVIHDQTMKSLKPAADRLDDYERAGYDLHGHYMHLNPEEATRRAIKRFKGGDKKDGQSTETGRFVPPDVVMGNVDNEKNFEALSPRFSQWTAFDNRGSAPKFVGGSEHFDEQGNRKQTAKDRRVARR
jgi:predicted ABC-type ATPase